MIIKKNILFVCEKKRVFLFKKGKKKVDTKMKYEHFTRGKGSDSSSHKKGNLSCFLKIASKVKGKGCYNRDMRDITNGGILAVIGVS